MSQTFYDVIQVKYWPKNAQISESDIDKPQNWKNSLYLGNLQFLGVILWWNFDS